MFPDRACSSEGTLVARSRVSVPWLCGYVREQDCHRYVAHNFYGEIRRYFRWLGGTPHRPSAKPVALKED